MDFILQTELPRGSKVPKFTKFSGDTSESTVEHIARYLTETGDLENTENLRIKYFPSSLIKNAFTWFTTLPPNSIDAWPHLEIMLHEQFYMGQTKISLKELASFKRKFTEPINDYLNWFRLLKSRCFTVVPEYELVEMAADRVRQVEGLKAEKARANKSYKKERVAYVEAEDEEFDTFDNSYNYEEVEVDLAELKEAPPYACKMLTHSNGGNPVEVEKNGTFPKKTYTFDVTNCDEIFNLFDGHLKYADKGKGNMKLDDDPLHVAATNYAESVEINMVDMVEARENETMKVAIISKGKQATESLNDDMTFNTDVEGSSA
ncbi:uncharacterized protein LOC131604689 [Vicia villosa]|uniref:uncharacterized protein LOC131604689 n=1 Tax=Vicia villosa TaxID=3911 RepID=UPI00273C6339|nr:uncharacterized protein LOC131604689 [Vicia villosa]